MSSLDRILPFLRPIEDLLRDPASHRADGQRRRPARVCRASRRSRAGARPHTRITEPDRRDQEHRAGVRRRDFGDATDPRCPAGGWLSRCRDVPAVRRRRSGPDHPQVRPTIHARRPGGNRHVIAGACSPARRRDRRRAQHPDFRRHRNGKDDAVERLGGSDP